MIQVKDANGFEEKKRFEITRQTVPVVARKNGKA